MVAVQCNMMRKWSEVLRCQARWRGCYAKSCAGGVEYNWVRFGWYIGA